MTTVPPDVTVMDLISSSQIPGMTSDKAEVSQTSQDDSTTGKPLVGSSTNTMSSASSSMPVTSEFESKSIEEVVTPSSNTVASAISTIAGEVTLSSTSASSQEPVPHASTSASQEPVPHASTSASDGQTLASDSTLIGMTTISSLSNESTSLDSSEISSNDTVISMTDTTTMHSNDVSAESMAYTTDSTSISLDSTNSSNEYATVTVTDASYSDDMTQSTGNVTDEATTDSTILLTTNESNLYTSAPDVSTIVTSTFTIGDNGHGTQITETTLGEQDVTTDSSTTQFTEDTGLERTTAHSTTSEDDDETVTSIMYELHFRGDCSMISSQDIKDVFINNIKKLLAEPLQTEMQNIIIHTIQCGSLYFNVTFKRKSLANLSVHLDELLNSNTTIQIDENNTLKFQFEDFKYIPMEFEGSPTSTSELSTSTEELTTSQNIVPSDLAFIFKFTGDCSVLMTNATGSNGNVNKGHSTIIKVSTASWTSLSTGKIDKKDATSAVPQTYTVDENTENSNDTNQSSSVKSTSGIEELKNTMTSLSDNSETIIDTTTILSEVTTMLPSVTTPPEVTNDEHLTMHSTKIKRSEETVEDISTMIPTSNSSPTLNPEKVTMEISTVSQQTDGTSEESSSPHTDLKTSDLLGASFNNLYANLTAKEQFEAILTEKLSTTLEIPQNLIFLGPVSCGSVLINITIKNQLNKEEVESQVFDLPNQLKNFTITITDHMGQSHDYKLEAVSKSKVKITDQTTTPTPYDEEDKGLTEIELIIIIVCGVFGGMLLLALIAFVIYRCSSSRNRKSFALGESPTQMNLEDFTLTKMTRPSPVYTDQGVTYTNRPKQAPAYNNPIYHSNNGHFENHNNPAGSGSVSAMRSSRENLVPQSGGPHVGGGGGVENPSFASDDLLDSGSNTSTELPYDEKVEMNVIGEQNQQML